MPSFCEASPGLAQAFSADANDSQAFGTGLDAVIDVIKRTSEAAPEQVKKDLSYLVGRYEEVKTAIAAGESPSVAVGHLLERRQEFDAAAASFAAYREQVC